MAVTCASDPVVLSWHDLHVSVRLPRGGYLHILRYVSGMAGPPSHLAPAGGRVTQGSMLAVLGPSGAGKTVRPWEEWV